MDRFVCVRLTRANDLDLSLLQFDPELSFAVIFLNADKAVYGRYGSRSDFYKSERDISLPGLRKAMESVLELHKNYPANKALLAAKKGPKPRYAVPTDYPWLSGRSRRDRGCMHCHHIGTAEQMRFRSAGKPIPDKALFSWPMPDAVGLNLDPQEKAKVKSVMERSPAASAGLQQGDEIQTLAGQPIVSTADVQWVLHNTPSPARLTAEVLRDGQKLSVALSLGEAWRHNVDISWRTTTLLLRRRLLGGMMLEELSAADREKAGLPATGMALRIWQLFRTSRAYEAGVRSKDILVSIDGQTDDWSINDLYAYCAQQKMPGDELSLIVLREGKRIKQKLRVE